MLRGEAAVAAICALVGLGACRDAARTEVVVHVGSTSSGAELERYVVSAGGQMTELARPADGDALFALVPKDAPDREVVFSVRGLGASGEVAVVSRTVTHFVSGQVVHLYACLDRRCATDAAACSGAFAASGVFDPARDAIEGAPAEWSRCIAGGARDGGGDDADSGRVHDDADEAAGDGGLGGDGADGSEDAGDADDSDDADEATDGDARPDTERPDAHPDHTDGNDLDASDATPTPTSDSGLDGGGSDANDANNANDAGGNADTGPADAGTRWAFTVGEDSDDFVSHLIPTTNGFAGVIVYEDDTLVNGTTYTGPPDVDSAVLFEVAPDGTFLWSENITATEGVEIGGLAEDNGEIYVAGSFEGTLTFVTTDTSPDSDVFVMKFDPLNVSMTMSRTVVASAGDEHINALQLANNRLTVGGSFSSGPYSLRVATALCRMQKLGNGDDAFVAVFNTAAPPVCLWANAFGSDGPDSTEALAVDPQSNNIYAAGVFRGAFSRAAGIIFSGGATQDIFVLALDPSGAYQNGSWLGGTAGDEVDTIAFDANSGLALGGELSPLLSFNGVPQTDIAAPYILLLSADLTVLQYATADDRLHIRDVEWFGSGELALIGDFDLSGAVRDFSGAATQLTVVPAAPVKGGDPDDIVYIELANHRTFSIVTAFGGAGDDKAFAFSRIPAGDVVVGGQLRRTLDLHGTTLEPFDFNPAVVNPYDGFLHRFTP